MGDAWTLWMSGLPGSRFPVESDYSPAFLNSVLDVVVSMHSAMRRDANAEAHRYRRMAVEPINTVSGFGNSDSVLSGCERLRSAVSDEWISKLPVIPQHGDFFSGNLLRHHSQWSIVDWESFGVVDLPAYDFFTFLLSLLQSHGSDPRKWSAELRTHAPDLSRAYARHFQLTPEDLKLLLPLTLTNWFHLQWTDGRQEFASRMYTSLANYFAQTELWEKAILG